MLVPPILGRPLIIYISATVVSLGVHVAQLDDNGQVISYQLEDSLVQDDHPIVRDFLDESIITVTSSMQWKLYFDGSQM